MKGKKRFIVKFFKILLFIIFIVAVSILNNAIVNVIFGDMQNEQKIKRDYEEKKQKCEMLQEIANSTIQEGICIDIGKIPNDVEYRIENDDDNKKIIFYYYFPEDSRSSPKYNATITLSKDYKILKEEYSIEIESFDEFLKNCNFNNKYLETLFFIFCFVEFYLLIYMFKNIISNLLKMYIKEKIVKNKKQDTIKL